MDIFSVKNSNKVERLTVDNYNKLTNRKAPYYQTINKDQKHFAICPECKNPILIINLYIDEENQDRTKDKLPLYAKHVKYNVNDIADYSASAYHDCPLANPSSVTGGGKRTTGSIMSDEIKRIVKKYPFVIYGFIGRILGLSISEDRLFKTMIENFNNEEGYRYKGVTKYNLPYTFLYMTNNTNILYNFLWDDHPIGQLIKKNIENRCRNIVINNNFIKVKDTNKFTKLEMYFTNHSVSKDRETMQLVLQESIKGEEAKEILTCTIKFTEKDYFVNTINQHDRLHQMVNSIIK